MVVLNRDELCKQFEQLPTADAYKLAVRNAPFLDVVALQNQPGFQAAILWLVPLHPMIAASLINRIPMLAKALLMGVVQELCSDCSSEDLTYILNNWGAEKDKVDGYVKNLRGLRSLSQELDILEDIAQDEKP